MITNEKKPVIVFGYDNWVVGGVEKVLVCCIVDI